MLDPSGHGAGLGVPVGRPDGLCDRRLHPADAGRSLGRDPLRWEVVANARGLGLPDATGRWLGKESQELSLPTRISDRGGLVSNRPRGPLGLSSSGQGLDPRSDLPLALGTSAPGRSASSAGRSPGGLQPERLPLLGVKVTDPFVDGTICDSPGDRVELKTMTSTTLSFIQASPRGRGSPASIAGSAASTSAMT